MNVLKNVLGKWLMLFCGVAAILTHQHLGVGQEVTATPGIVNLAPLAPTSPGLGVLPTATPMPTQGALVRLEAKEFANVRAEPSTESNTLGQIRAGETYTVLARYAAWIQFQFPGAPDGRGWVFGELVNLVGDSATIPEIDPFITQATAASESALALNAEGAAQLLTATSLAQSVAIGIAATRLPTFTYPPGMSALAPTEVIVSAEPSTTPDVIEGTPPIVPILILGGLGLAGLALGAVRRG